MKIKDLIGKKFGRLTVLRLAAARRNSHTCWVCSCDCGNISIVRRTGLTSGGTRSCGCLHKEELGNIRRTHAHSRVGSGTYKSWLGMKDRCNNSNHSAYHYYGGRGVFVCDRWNKSFENFLKDMGERPIGMTIDRIDPNGNYEPSNCRWADWTTQRNNQRKKQ